MTIKNNFKYPSQLDMIMDLKKRFPLNNPAGWAKNSQKQIKKWWKENIHKEN